MTLLHQNHCPETTIDKIGFKNGQIGSDKQKNRESLTEQTGCKKRKTGSDKQTIRVSETE